MDLNVFVWTSYFIVLYFLVYWLILFVEKGSIIKKEAEEKIKIRRCPLVSVIIPAYNESPNIEKTLDSLAKLDYPADKIEVIIVNDGSTDGTEEIVRKFIKKHETRKIILMSQKNQGKAAALNNGLKRIKGEYFACLDADSFVDKLTLKYMISKYEQNPDIAILTPILKICNPQTLLQKFQRLEYMASMLITKLMSYIDANYIAPGPFSLYRTQVIKKLGPFNGKHNLEDQEMAYRAQKNNYKIRQCPKALVYTVAPQDFKKLAGQRTRWYSGSLLTMYDYRHMFFNKKYGDFGMFLMPLNLINYFLPIIALLSFFYFIVKPITRNLYNFYLVGFDMHPYLKNLKFTFDFLNIDVSSLYIIYLMLFIAIVFLYFSSGIAEERVRKYGSIHILPYFFFYYILLSFLIVESIAIVIFRIKQRW